MSFLVCTSFVLAAATDVRLVDGPHPHVFMSPAEVAHLRVRVEAQPWAQAITEGVKKRAEDVASGPLDIPHSEGQWTHWWSCKDDGGSLKSKSPTEHVCTICDRMYTGWPYDQVYVTYRHHAWLHGVEALGIAYALDPQPKYAARARDILLEYASFYRDLELHDVHNKQGSAKARLFSQTLDESVDLCHIVMGYDLVYGASEFSEADHRAIEDGLLRPMVETIRANDRGISNWQTWHNAGVASAGFLLGDAELVDWATNGESGLLFQLEHSVLGSGMWYEASPVYHWYSLMALTYHLEGARRAGMDLYAHPVVKKLFDAPIRLLMPDGTFPPLNDSNRGNISGSRSHYEVAYARFNDPSYAPLLVPRDSRNALLWGVDTVVCPMTPLAPRESDNIESDGLAILRNSDTALYFDYGPGTSGHVHPAKLGLILYAHGDERLVDPGRLPYGNPLHGEWYKQTVAHNSVVVNQKSQRRAPGRLIRYLSDEQSTVALASLENAYDGVVIERSVTLRGNVIIDMVRCVAEEESVFDLPLHFRGELVGQEGAEPAGPLGEDNGYQHLQNVHRLASSTSVIHLTTRGEDRLRVGIHEDSEGFIAEGYGSRPTELLPMLLRRQRGKQALFLTTIEVLDAGDDSPPVSVSFGEKLGAAEGSISLELLTPELQSQNSPP
jgi:heparinase II/III-like protein/alginate lyase